MRLEPAEFGAGTAVFWSSPRTASACCRLFDVQPFACSSSATAPATCGGRDTLYITDNGTVTASLPLIASDVVFPCSPYWMQRRSTQRSTAALSVSGRSQQSTSERNSLHSTASKGVSVKFNDWFEAVRKYGALMTRDMVAAALGVSRQRVHQLIGSGKIAAVRVGDHDYVSLAALEIFRSTRVRSQSPAANVASRRRSDT